MVLSSNSVEEQNQLLCSECGETAEQVLRRQLEPCIITHASIQVTLSPPPHNCNHLPRLSPSTSMAWHGGAVAAVWERAGGRAGASGPQL